jgi:hypothetical protein
MSKEEQCKDGSVEIVSDYFLADVNVIARFVDRNGLFFFLIVVFPDLLKHKLAGPGFSAGPPDDWIQRGTVRDRELPPGQINPGKKI